MNGIEGETEKCLLRILNTRGRDQRISIKPGRIEAESIIQFSFVVSKSTDSKR